MPNIDASSVPIAASVVAFGSIFLVAGVLFRMGVYQPENWIRLLREGRLSAAQRGLALIMLPGGLTLVCAGLVVGVGDLRARIGLLILSGAAASLTALIYRWTPNWAQPSWLTGEEAHLTWSPQRQGSGLGWVWFGIAVAWISCGVWVYSALGNSFAFDGLVVASLGAGLGALLSHRAGSSTAP